MNIYLISQNKNTGYDTFDSAVVIAESAEVASTIRPESIWHDSPYTYAISYDDTWVTDPADVTVELIGVANTTERKCICASFNAG